MSHTLAGINSNPPAADFKNRGAVPSASDDVLKLQEKIIK